MSLDSKLFEINCGSKSSGMPFSIDSIPSIGHLVQITLNDTANKGYIYLFIEKDTSTKAYSTVVKGIRNLPLSKNTKIADIVADGKTDIYETIKDDIQRGHRVYAFPVDHFYEKDMFNADLFLDFVEKYL